MFSSLWATSLLHLSFGIAFYFVFQAWGILAETTASDAPNRRSRGATGFALGQAVAITGLLALSLMCGRILFQFFHQHGLETIPLWFAGAVTFAEGLAATLNRPLVPGHSHIGLPSFGAGRDLIIRHAAPLFLILTATASWLGPSASSMIAGGCVLGWGAIQMLGGPSAWFPLLWVRRGTAILGLGMSIMLLRAALKWSF